MNHVTRDSPFFKPVSIKCPLLKIQMDRVIALNSSVAQDARDKVNSSDTETRLAQETVSVVDSPVKLCASLRNFQDSCRSCRGVTLPWAPALHVVVEHIELCLVTEDASIVTLHSYES